MFSNCPRCSGAVKSAGQTFFCSCGWSHSQANHDKGIQKKVVFSMFLSACLFSGLILYFFHWGGKGLAVLTANSQQKLEICMSLKKYDCVEQSYEKLFGENGDVEILNALGQFQFQRGHYDKSSKTYSQYFANGGKDYRAAHYYAHSLVKTNQLDEAIVYFESILNNSKNTLMVTVVESYLNVLVSHNRHQKAKEVLERVKEMAKNSANTQSQIIKWEKQFNI